MSRDEAQATRVDCDEESEGDLLNDHAKQDDEDWKELKDKLHANLRPEPPTIPRGG